MSSALAFALFDQGYNPGDKEAANAPADPTAAPDVLPDPSFAPQQPQQSHAPGSLEPPSPGPSQQPNLTSRLNLADTQRNPLTPIQVDSSQYPNRRIDPLLQPWVNVSPSEALGMYGGGGAGMVADPISGAMVGNQIADYWNLLKQGGQAAAGQLPMAQEPGPNQLSMPEFSVQLALMGLMGRAPSLIRAGGRIDPTVVEQFGGYHGTGVNRPFTDFDLGMAGSGTGRWHEGYGIYIGERQGTGETYREHVAGNDIVLTDADGFPLPYDKHIEEYYKPGSIVPASGGRFQRILDFKRDPNWNTNWQVQSQIVHPDRDAFLSKYSEIPGNLRYAHRDDFPIPADAMNHPELWSDQMYPGAPPSQPYWHDTEPEDMHVESVAEARGTKTAQSGALVNVHIIPERHEFFDLSEPWRRQTQDIKDKMTGMGFDPYTLHKEGYLTFRGMNIDPNEVYGHDILRGLERREEHRSVLSPEEAQKVVSSDLDYAGIPGNKYLDYESRGKLYSPGLKYSGHFSDAPDPQLARQFLEDYPAITGGDTNTELNILHQHLQGLIDNRTAAMNSMVGTYPAHVADSLKFEIAHHQDLLNWIKQEQAAGKFSIGDLRTHNFVVFHPRNVKITAWNGMPMNYVYHDPFAPPSPGGTP